MLDLLVHGGQILDGTGAPAYRADLGVAGGRIAAIGRIDPGDLPDDRLIDATGRYVVPGLIDAHSHADATVLDPQVQLANLRQGVTTVVLGQDGLSFAPADPPALRFVSRYFAGINGVHPDIDDGPVTVADLLSTYRGTTALNTAYLVPHGTLRFAGLGGSDRAPEPDELKQMVAAIERGLSEGAVGLSTGLEYLPGRYAYTAELVALCGPIAAAGLPYVSHLRGYEAAIATGMAGLTAVAAGGRVAAHISHYHGPGDELVTLLDQAIGSGLDVTFDSYPYQRGASILAMVALPRWLDDTDLDSTLHALTDPAVRQAIREQTDPELWQRITLAYVNSPQWAWTSGQRLTEAAEVARVDPAELCVELLVATGLTATAVFDQPPTNSDESVRTLLRHPAHMGGSDGIYLGRYAHPRGWGAFARLLARHVRELGDWTWPEAIVHLSSHPARRFRLLDRGLLRPGCAADVAVVSPVSVADRADYDQPREPAVGVDDVIVNGVAVLRGGNVTGARPGTPLSPG